MIKVLEIKSIEADLPKKHNSTSRNLIYIEGDNMTKGKSLIL